MVVAVMALVVGVLVAMDSRLVAVLVAIMAMSLSPVVVFVLMLVFALATHTVSPLWFNIYIITRFRLRHKPAEIKGQEPLRDGFIRSKLDIFFLLP